MSESTPILPRRRRAAEARTSRAGFSLAELMVVIVIIGLLSVLVVPSVVQRLDKAMVGKAKADVVAIAGALADFYVNNAGQWPDTLEILVTPDENGSTYLKSRKLPKDPWKNEYLYEPPTSSGARPRVYSLGKDGMVGGVGNNMDISNWEVEDGEA